MSKTLIITSSPRKDSLSTYLAKEFGSYLKNSETEILDVSKIHFPKYDELTMEHYAGLCDIKEIREFCDPIIEQFVSADNYVFAFPNWQQFLPSELVAYATYAFKVGVAFAYDEQGAKPLLKNKKALLIHTNGGLYIENVNCYAISWLKSLLNISGVEEVYTVIAQNVDTAPHLIEQTKATALNELKEVADKF